MEIKLVSKGDGDFYITDFWLNDDPGCLSAVVKAEVHFHGFGESDITIFYPRTLTGVPKGLLYPCPSSVRDKYIELMKEDSSLTEEQRLYTINGKII